MKQEKIPVHRLPDNGHIGIEIKKFIDIDSTKILQNEPHRDDHYLLFFQESGESRIMVDFNEIENAFSGIAFENNVAFFLCFIYFFMELYAEVHPW